MIGTFRRIYAVTAAAPIKRAERRGKHRCRPAAVRRGPYRRHRRRHPRFRRPPARYRVPAVSFYLPRRLRRSSSTLPTRRWSRRCHPPYACPPLPAHLPPNPLAIMPSCCRNRRSLSPGRRWRRSTGTKYPIIRYLNWEEKRRWNNAFRVYFFSFPYGIDNRRWSANETFGPSWRMSIRIRRWRTWIGPRWRVSSVNKHRRWFHRRPARPRAASASTSNDVVENRRRLLLLFSFCSIIY